MIDRSQARRVGEVLGGKYRLLRYLASGGMGAVYEAQHTVVKRRFAIKVLHAELAVERENLMRFEREAQAAGALESENVAAAIDFGITEDGSPFIVMEYLSGESLRDLLDRCGRLPVGRATDLVVQACRGVEAAHRAGIVHRDLNPQNLFVCRREDGTDLVKVLDFGIAKLTATESAQTRTGSVLGTPAYLSPEQARGEKTVGPASDVYGLGAVLYELLSNERPHPGESHNAILHHICTQPARPLDPEALHLPAVLVSAVTRALSSSPALRQPSVDALAREIAPFARREVWPPVERVAEPSQVSVVASTFERPAADAPSAPRRRWLGLAVAGAMAVATAVALGMWLRPRPTLGSFVERPLARDTRFFVPPPNPGAVEQIASLVKTKATREAAAITAMESMPQAVWFSKGSPEEVQGYVSNTIVRAQNDGSIPVLVAYNRPYRDCAGFSAGGAKDTAAYKAWIDGFARGIGHERAIVVLEPDSTGVIPYNVSLDGTSDWCKPTATNAKGATVPAPGASPAEEYAQINYAVRALRDHAPNALVYLDGAHASWLSVGEVAFRLYKSGVLRTQGFAVNVSNFRPTDHSIRYGVWISKCLDYATRLVSDRAQPAAFARCASQPMSSTMFDEKAWGETEQWYVANVDRISRPASASSLAHFVIDSGRNGQPPLDPAKYADEPYNQPADVIERLRSGAWCNPPGMGLGLRPTADTGLPLLDAYLWIKTVGESDGSCDVAGGTRAWSYEKYNPWGLSADGQRHFDPLWGMVNPAAGTWFPEQALELARLAVPALMP